MIVADASALVEVLARDSPDPDLALRLASEDLHVPHLVDVEVVHALRGLLRRKDLTAARATQAVDDFASMALTRYPHFSLVPRMWQLRGTLSAYDAVYVALAEELDVPLVTVDDCLGAATGHRAAVERY
jgi:predicted nucleic acid-binding protein